MSASKLQLFLLEHNIVPVVNLLSTSWSADVFQSLENKPYRVPDKNNRNYFTGLHALFTPTIVY